MNFRDNFDLSVYFVADPSLTEGRPLADVVAAAIRGGVTIVQLRAKDYGTADLVRIGAELLGITRESNIPLLINDNVEAARDIGADGAHIGQGDMDPAQARAIIGPDAILGLTAFKPEHFAAISPGIVDYAGCGPFYPTQTDKGKPLLGAAGFRGVIAHARVPVVGIGGINAGNAAAVIKAGADGVAMMRSISAASDPEAAARDIASAVAQARQATS